MNESNLIARDKNAVWHPFTPLSGMREPLEVVAAQGSYLHLRNGNRILDAISSWWVNLHGHAHPHIAQAVAQQAHTLEHVLFAGFTHAPAVLLAERLLGILPANQKKVFFSDNGSTATEVAMKMAFQYWYNRGETQKTTIVALDGAYHGDTFGAMSVGDKSPFNAPFRPFLFDVEFLEFPSPDKEEAVLERFLNIARKQKTAAFIFEPLIQGASGMRTYSAQCLDKLIKIAHENNIICIADEVMTGFGRTGSLFASDKLTHKPDIICLSKGITGGFLPLGATTCTAAIQEAYQSEDLMKTFFHGHSYTANPLACAAANASLDLLLADDCSNQRQQIQDQHQEFAQQLQTLDTVRNVRVLGTIVALEINTKGETSYINEARNQLYYHFLDQQILLRPLGNVLYILPPYCITTQELALVYEKIIDFCKTL